MWGIAFRALDCSATIWDGLRYVCVLRERRGDLLWFGRWVGMLWDLGVVICA